MKLAHQVALITGANQGLGAQIARRFRAEGAHVAIGARGETALEDTARDLRDLPAPGEVLARRLDVTREPEVEAWIAAAQARWGRIDILVNCAGSAGPRGPLDELDWSAWKEAMEINILGTAYPSRVVTPIMKAAGRGKIINLSGGGATKPLPHLSAYAASKAAVVRLTETLALELKPWKIDVNAVAPGVLYTKLVDDFVEAGEAQLGRAYFEEVQRQKANPQPAFDLATGLCLFLASAESDGITGRLLSANWDPWAGLPARREALAKSDVYTLRRIVPGDRGLDWDARA